MAALKPWNLALNPGHLKPEAALLLLSGWLMVLRQQCLAGLYILFREFRNLNF